MSPGRFFSWRKARGKACGSKPLLFFVSQLASEATAARFEKCARHVNCDLVHAHAALCLHVESFCTLDHATCSWAHLGNYQETFAHASVQTLCKVNLNAVHVRALAFNSQVMMAATRGGEDAEVALVRAAISTINSDCVRVVSSTACLL